MSRSRESRERAERKGRAKAAWRGRKLHLKWASGERCSTCAYRAGTVASGDDDDPGLTRLRRALLDAAHPFFCHEGPDGRELAPEVPDSQRRLCIGHANALTARHRAGYYEAHPPDAPEVIAELRAAHEERNRIFVEHLLGLGGHVKQFSLGQRVHVVRDHEGQLIDAPGRVKRLRIADDGAWIALDVRNDHCPFPADDVTRSTHIMAYPADCREVP